MIRKYIHVSSSGFRFSFKKQNLHMESARQIVVQLTIDIDLVSVLKS